MTAQCNREGGFTLIEILIAFAILAIGLLVLLDPLREGLSRNARDRDYEHAVALAQSKLAELGSETPWFVGMRTGDVDDRFAWRLDIKSSRDHQETDESEAIWQLLDIDVTISWSGAFHQRSFSLSTTRLIFSAELGK